jgi:gliding motility-associated-like protein
MKLSLIGFAFLLSSMFSYGQVTANFYAEDQAICEGDCLRFINTSTGDITSYAWTILGASPNNSTSENPYVCYPNTGDYSVSLTVTGPDGTNTYDSIVSVGVYPDSVTVTRDTTIEMGGVAFLQAVGYSQQGGGVFFWPQEDIVSCQPLCNQIFANPLVTTNVIAQFISIDGCITEGSAKVTVKYEDVIDVPNTFTPNLDGINEEVFVKGPGITSMSFRIFDRYGKLMFETTDQEEGWDGTYNGGLLNPSAFLWTLEYTLINGESNTKSGSITLLK